MAPAKVNLFLRVVGRRADGYHLLQSLAVFAGAHDVVAAAPADALTLTLDGRFGAALAVQADNLVLLAARALADSCGVRGGAALSLEKNLPVASGIGGGSADAAAALRALVRLWNLDVPADTLARLALGLGADVPVCLARQSAVMQGVGDILRPAPALPPFGLLLVNPGVGVATPAVFRARDGGFSAPAVLPAGWADAREMAGALAALGNDLQVPALRLCPVIGDVLAAIAAAPGCLLAQMSGSGATCFGLFGSAAEAAGAAGLCRLPGWWAWGGAAWGFTTGGVGP
jgi:4-diphosphocytidyl-2-C-methyl-D-erythritol kinase